MRIALIMIGSLTAIALLTAGVLYAVIASSFNGIQHVSIAADPALKRPAASSATAGTEAPMNILLLGSDSRSKLDPEVTPDALTGYRSDAILVAQISGDRSHVTFMSIMRDNWVAVQGFGDAKINAAMSYGGVPLAVNTVENFIGARIDHVALIDFESFAGMTDALGGITVHNQIPFTAHRESGVFDFAKGTITLDGDEALAYVRERYAFPDGDYQRVRDQQAYLAGFLTKLLSGETLRDPGKLVATFQALKPYLILDDGFTLEAAASLGFESQKLRSDDVSFFTSPTLGVGTSADGQSIVIPDEQELDAIRAAFRDGTLAQYAAEHPATA